MHAPFLLAQLSKAEARKSRISLYKQREAREGRIAKISSCEARKSRITERNKMSTYEELEKAEQEAETYRLVARGLHTLLTPHIKEIRELLKEFRRQLFSVYFFRFSSKCRVT